MDHGVLYRAKLIARWLSVWGFIGLALAMSASLLVLSRLTEVVTTTYLTLTVVLALQQVALAVWLIVKGLNASVEVPPLA